MHQVIYNLVHSKYNDSYYDGSYHKTGGTLHADGTFTFATNHFSAYAIMTEEKSIYYTDYLLKTIRIAR